MKILHLTLMNILQNIKLLKRWYLSAIEINGCDGTDVLVVQPGYRLISIADKYQFIINNIKKCRLLSLTKLQKLEAYKINISFR